MHAPSSNGPKRPIVNVESKHTLKGTRQRPEGHSPVASGRLAAGVCRGHRKHCCTEGRQEAFRWNHKDNNNNNNNNVQFERRRSDTMAEKNPLDRVNTRDARWETCLR